MDLKFKERWKHTPVAIRKPFILIVGSSVILTGLAMLVLPGPGWAAIFLGFAILATEFAFAVTVRDWLIKELKLIISNGKQAWLAFFRRIRKS